MDTKTIGLIGTIAKVLIAVLGAVFCVLVIMNSEAIQGGENVNYLDSGLAITYVAMAVCVGIVLLFGLFHFVSNIGKSKGMLYTLVGFLIVLGVSYAMADGSLTNEWSGKGITEKVSKMTSMGIGATFLLLAIAVVTAVWSEVSKLIK